MESLQREASDVRLETAADAEEAMAMIEDAAFGMILFEADRGDGEEEWSYFARWVRRREDLASCLLILVAGASPAQPATFPHADGVLRHPIDRQDLARYHRIAQCMREPTIRHKDNTIGSASRHVVPASATGDLMALLEATLELGIPGAKRRGDWIAAHALMMAKRFEIPGRFLEDLAIVARFHEIGRLIESGRDRDASHRSAAGGDWTYVLATRGLFQRVPGLKVAAQIVGSIFENWDGSGRPGHLQRGEIPLRSRILRILVDYRAMVENCARAENGILEKLEQHAGTWYDRVAFVFLKEVLSSPGDHRESEWDCLVQVSELQPGMVLAEDLFTDSGIKLLARGTVLGPATIDIITRRDAIDPILQRIAIDRRGPA